MRTLILKFFSSKLRTAIVVAACWIGLVFALSGTHHVPIPLLLAAVALMAIVQVAEFINGMRAGYEHKARPYREASTLVCLQIRQLLVDAVGEEEADRRIQKVFEDAEALRNP